MTTINLTQLSKSIAARLSCIEKMNTEWKYKHEERIDELCKELPHGSGIDARCEIDLEQSKENRIVFYFEYHHMDENVFYCGWTEHNVIITPNFGSFNIRITGKDKNQCKEYFYELWSNVFSINETVTI